MNIINNILKTLIFIIVIIGIINIYFAIELGMYTQANYTVKKFNLDINEVYPSYKYNPWYKIDTYLNEYLEDKKETNE